AKTGHDRFAARPSPPPGPLARADLPPPGGGGGHVIAASYVWPDTSAEAQICPSDAFFSPLSPPASLSFLRRHIAARRPLRWFSSEAQRSSTGSPTPPFATARC